MICAALKRFLGARLARVGLFPTEFGCLGDFVAVIGGLQHVLGAWHRFDGLPLPTKYLVSVPGIPAFGVHTDYFITQDRGIGLAANLSPYNQSVLLDEKEPL